MKIINQTDKDIEVQLSGVKYKLEASGELSNVPQKDAVYWRDRLHNFLILEEEDNEKIGREEIADDEDEDTREIEVDLVKLTRPQLNEVAVKSGLRQPEDYPTKEELADAVMALDE